MSTAILITGCSTGIGYHCAMHFIKRVIKLLPAVAPQKMLPPYKRKGYIVYSLISPLASQFNRD
nr:hypothetical protein [Photobacterium frigidiphilum]